MHNKGSVNGLFNLRSEQLQQIDVKFRYDVITGYENHDNLTNIMKRWL